MHDTDMPDPGSNESEGPNFVAGDTEFDAPDFYRTIIGPDTYNLPVDADGTIALDPNNPEHKVPIRKVFLELIDNNGNFPGWKGSNGDLPEIDELYENLGFSNQDNELKFPTPKAFKERLDELRQTDRSGLYIPEIAVVNGGKVSVADYLKAFAEHKMPITGSDIEFYLHDVGEDHFQGLLVYGEPLMDLCAAFAQATLNSDAESLLNDATIMDYARRWYGFDAADLVKDLDSAHDLRGKAIAARREAAKAAGREASRELDVEAGIVIDTVTGVFGDSSINADEFSQPAIEISAESHNNHMQIMVDTLRVAGTLGEAEVVKSLIESRQITDESEVTGAMVSREIVRLARDRLGVEQEAA